MAIEISNALWYYILLYFDQISNEIYENWHSTTTDGTTVIRTRARWPWMSASLSPMTVTSSTDGFWRMAFINDVTFWREHTNCINTSKMAPALCDFRDSIWSRNTFVVWNLKKKRCRQMIMMTMFNIKMIWPLLGFEPGSFGIQFHHSTDPLKGLTN